MSNKINSEPKNEEISNLIELIKSGKYKIAENTCKKLIKQFPNSFNLLNFLGLALTNQNQISMGIKCYESAIKFKPDFAQAYNNLGIALKNIGKINDASIAYINAIKYKPDFAEAYNNLGLIMMDLGKTEDAKTNFHKAIKINPNLSFAHRHLSIVTKYSENDSHISEMKQALSNSKISDDGKMHIAFGLGKAFDDINKYDDAFGYFQLGNNLRRRKIKYNIKNDIIFFNNLKNTFNKNLFEKFRNSKNIDNTPIFIVGMFRSGTTLIEQILASHSEVFGGGESRALIQAIYKFLNSDSQNNFLKELEKCEPDKINNIGKSYITAARKFQPYYKHITDKQPINFKWIGIIKLALPNAKVIHCVRNPMDNCLSIYKNYFNFEDNPYSYDLKEIAQYYKIYKELMNYWKAIFPNFIYDISYEKLIENQKEETKKLLDFCDLSWDNSCMNFHKNKRNVSTASVMQVRQPIYKNSVNLWKKYKKHLADLIKELN